MQQWLFNPLSEFSARADLECRDYVISALLVGLPPNLGQHSPHTRPIPVQAAKKQPGFHIISSQTAFRRPGTLQIQP